MPHFKPSDRGQPLGEIPTAGSESCTGTGQYRAARNYAELLDKRASTAKHSIPYRFSAGLYRSKDESPCEVTGLVLGAGDLTVAAQVVVSVRKAGIKGSWVFSRPCVLVNVDSCEGRLRHTKGERHGGRDIAFSDCYDMTKCLTQISMYLSTGGENEACLFVSMRNSYLQGREYSILRKGAITPNAIENRQTLY